MTNLPSTQKRMSLMDMINARRDEIGKVLPKGVTIDTFTRVLANAVLKDPNIERLDPRLVFLEVSKAAQDGLVLDGRESALVSYGGRVSYIPMALGIRKRALQSGQIKSLYSGVVYDQEIKQGRFKYLPVSESPIYHEPILGGDLGNVVAVYSLAVLSDGTHSVELMRADEIESIRKRSKSGGGGPWSTDYNEMAKKTVFRRHSKSLPLGDSFRGVFERVDALYDLNKPRVSAADMLSISVDANEVVEQPKLTSSVDDDVFVDDIPPPTEEDVF